jgi:SAM-dependent methyltransferase
VSARTAAAIQLDLRYDAELAALGRYAPAFRALGPDAELEAWLARYAGAPHGRLTTLLASCLDGLLTSYDVHGLLGTYPMHLLSQAAWRDLLGPHERGTLLDVGAGAGYVTEGARACFDRIVCTETARYLRKRLARRGFEVLASDLSEVRLERSFDVVSCFNVLDRTARPRTLLRNLISHLSAGGCLLISVPLPVSAHVHVPGGTTSASERLPASARSWEGAVCELGERLLEASGLNVERVARVPYLSRGDPTQDLYVLDAAVWVCRRASSATTR